MPSFTSPGAAAPSPTSSVRSAYPSSINTSHNIHDVFTSPTREREQATSPSPTSPLRPNTGNSAVSSTGPYGMLGPYPRMYPYGVSSQPTSISSRRGANAFDGIPSAWRYPPNSSTAGGFEHDVDEADDEFTAGSNCSYAFSASQTAHTHTSNHHYHHHPHHPQQPQHSQLQLHHLQDQRLQQEQEKKKKKADVVYASGTSHGATGGGGTLSKMTSFTNLNLAQLSSPIQSMRGKKKKKRLIISGVAVNDLKKFEGVKRWCESFGEVRQILRMPNGDLVVSFQSADVADTVCRVRAKVFINGVGSVLLSWTTEKKR
ncbi:hypothetical protein NP233_g10687 [Leucocoprinus birnbaumii]|uniref:RRM domain-containing protein n=1 Tax=Leucocoprinus birnbaumii TaxID=56174 RepID=A0AAD5VI88_9AGAR|nr:hypothetical protein NP233_g10687 [Leucocoprinus birnbaumii]